MRLALLISLAFAVVFGACSGVEFYSDLDVYDDVYIRHVSGRVRRSTDDQELAGQDLYSTDQDSDNATQHDPESTESDADSIQQDSESADLDADNSTKHDLGSSESDPVSTEQDSESTDLDADSLDEDSASAEKPESFEFPRRMTFSFTIKEKKVRLELRLNEHQLTHVPINVVTSTGIHRYSNDKVRDYAFYQLVGEVTGAAVMVRCPNFTYPCHMTGRFRVGGDEYLVEPNSEKPRLVSKAPHKVYKADHTATGSYRGDTKLNVKQEAGWNGHDDSQEANKGGNQAGNKGGNQGGRKGGNKGSGRTRRETTGLFNHKVELEMVVDFSEYNYWLQRLGDQTEAIETIQEYYEQVANMMDVRFRSLDSSTISVNIIPLEINIVMERSQNPWVSNNQKSQSDGSLLLDASPALDDFESWVITNRGRLSNFDAILTFTRENLASFSTTVSDSTLGLAQTWQDGNGQPISALCDNGNGRPAASIIEVTLSTARTAAHELAHLMGVIHDSDLGCNDEEQFVMAAYQRPRLTEATASNPWTFSTCSRNVLEYTFDRLVADDITCLQRNSYNIADYERIQSARMLGQIYSLGEQCVLAQGVGSRRCDFGEAAEAVCYQGIWCTYPGTNRCALMSVMPGSTCGNGTCIQGRCIATTTTTSKPTTTTTTPTTTTTTTTTTPTTTTTTPTTTTTTPTTTTTTPTTTTTTPTTTTTTPTTTTTTPTTTTTTPTTTTTTPTTTTTTPTTTTTTPTTTTTTKSTTTTKATTKIPPTTTRPPITTTPYCDWNCRWQRFLDYFAKKYGWTIRRPY